MFPTAQKSEPRVEGLRGLAIALVLLFHVGIPGLAGGYVGVDVFFVLSGFLITRGLIDELATTQRIRLCAFYARRARRLLPALTLVVLATLAASNAILSPVEEQQAVAASAAATGLFWANFYFMRETGDYFFGPGELQPLLHMWSLGVECQLYAIWPMLLRLCCSSGGLLKEQRRRLQLVLLSVVFVSGVGFLLLSAMAPTVSFYASPARAWEFALGALATTVAPDKGALFSKADSALLLGLFLVIAGAITGEFLEHGQAIGSLSAALGTAFALAAIRQCAEVGRSYLGSPPLIWLGAISYSLYLWHWPILSLSRSAALGERDLWRDSFAAAIAVGLAYATYRSLEGPVYRRQYRVMRSDRGATVIGSACVAAILLGSGATLWVANAKRNGDDRVRDLAQLAVRSSPFHENCHEAYPFDGHISAPSDCTLSGMPGGGPTMLWGDSHADHLVPEISALLSQEIATVRQRSMSSCPPVLNAQPRIGSTSISGCSEFNRQVAEEIEAGRVWQSIIMAAYWSAYLGEPTLNRTDRRIGYPEDSITNASAAEEWLTKNLRSTIERIRQHARQVVIVAPIPTLAYPAPACLARHEDIACAVRRREVEVGRRRALHVMQEAIAGAENVRIWDPIDLLCEAEFCRPIRGGRVLYRDADHLSSGASEILAEDLQKALRETSKPSH